MKKLYIILLFALTTFVASAQCGTLQYKVDNQPGCTYKLVIIYTSCTSQTINTACLTAVPNQSTYYFLPVCSLVTHLRIYDPSYSCGSGSGTVADIDAFVTIDPVGGCTADPGDKTAEWIDPQTT